MFGRATERRPCKRSFKDFVFFKVARVCFFQGFGRFWCQKPKINHTKQARGYKNSPEIMPKVTKKRRSQVSENGGPKFPVFWSDLRRPFSIISNVTSRAHSGPSGLFSCSFWCRPYTGRKIICLENFRKNVEVKKKGW